MPPTTTGWSVEDDLGRTDERGSPAYLAKYGCRTQLTAEAPGGAAVAPSSIGIEGMSGAALMELITQGATSAGPRDPDGYTCSLNDRRMREAIRIGAPHALKQLSPFSQGSSARSEDSGKARSSTFFGRSSTSTPPPVPARPTFARLQGLKAKPELNGVLVRLALLTADELERTAPDDRIVCVACEGPEFLPTLEAIVCQLLGTQHDGIRGDISSAFKDGMGASYEKMQRAVASPDFNTIAMLPSYRIKKANIAVDESLCEAASDIFVDAVLGPNRDGSASPPTHPYALGVLLKLCVPVLSPEVLGRDPEAWAKVHKELEFGPQALRPGDFKHMPFTSMTVTAGFSLQSADMPPTAITGAAGDQFYFSTATRRFGATGGMQYCAGAPPIEMQCNRTVPRRGHRWHETAAALVEAGFLFSCLSNAMNAIQTASAAVLSPGPEGTRAEMDRAMMSTLLNIAQVPLLHLRDMLTDERTARAVVGYFETCSNLDFFANFVVPDDITAFLAGRCVWWGCDFPPGLDGKDDDDSDQALRIAILRLQLIALVAEWSRRLEFPNEHGYRRLVRVRAAAAAGEPWAAKWATVASIRAANAASTAANDKSSPSRQRQFSCLPRESPMLEAEWRRSHVMLDLLQGFVDAEVKSIVDRAMAGE